VRRDHGLPHQPIVEFVGRQIDFIVLPNGKRISPYAVDAQLDEVPGLDQFRVVQHADLRVDIYVRTSALTTTQVHEEVERAFVALCDGLLRVQMHEWRDPRTSSAQKLRTIQSLARLG
jgi:long-subunit acyl-CoA synthetase (AMP-forming)